MRKNRKLRLAVGMVLAALGVSMIGIVAAAAPLTKVAKAAEKSETSSTVVVAPMWQEIILTPGESWSGSIRVSNPGTSSRNLKYEVSVGSYQRVPVEGEEGRSTDDVNAISDYNRMMDWITLEKTSGELEPNTVESVPFTINVPADAAGGGQYASIIVKNVTDEGENQSEVQIESMTQVASVLFAEVAGDTIQEGKILDNSMPGFLLSGDFQATSMIEDTGNVHGDVRYTLQVWKMGSDEEICTNEEEPEMAIVMPGSKLYHSQGCKLGMVGIYKAKQTVSLFGETSELERTVFVCPVWLIVLVVVAILAIACMIVWHNKKKR